MMLIKHNCFSTYLAGGIYEPGDVEWACASSIGQITEHISSLRKESV